MISCATTWTRLARKGNSGLITKARTDQQTFNIRDEDHAPEKLFYYFRHSHIISFAWKWRAGKEQLWEWMSAQFQFQKNIHAVAELTRALMLETGLLQQYFF